MKSPIEIDALTPTVDGETAETELAKLLANARRSAPPDRLHAPLRDEQLWGQLTDAGWHELGVTLDGEAPTKLRDMIAIAELCGYELVGMPLIGTLLARRWFAYEQNSQTQFDDSQRISALLPDLDGRYLIPYGESSDWVSVRSNGTLKMGGAGQLKDVLDDDYAPSLPLRSAIVEGINHSELHPIAIRESAILYTATTVGCAQRCLERSVDYSRERTAYGKLIGAHQAVRHIMADMYRDLELARSGVIGAAYEPDWLNLLTHCASLAQRIVASAIQVHGGIGFTWEAGLHYHTRHILAVRKLLGALPSASNIL